MALYDQVIDQQRSLYPGSNVLEIAIPPPASRLERYPGEEESGQRMPISPEDLMRLRQRFQPLPPDVPQDVPAPIMAPTPGPLRGTQPFGFHQMSQEQPANLWQMFGLPERYHPAYRRLQQMTSIPPRVISAEASIPHQVISSVMHPLFRLLFTGTPFSQQNALTRRFPGLSPSLPGRTAMGALADPAASVATFATEGEVAPEKLFGGARSTKNMWQGNPKGWSLRGTIPGAVYDTLEDIGTGTTRHERQMKDAFDNLYWKARQQEEEELALMRRRATQPLGSPQYRMSGPTYAPQGTRKGPFIDLPDQWYEKTYGGTDYMERFEEFLKKRAAQQAQDAAKKATRIPVLDLTKRPRK